MNGKKLKVKDLSYSFLPGWWAKNYGLKFGEQYYTDPEYRMEITKQINKIQRNEMRELYIVEPVDNIDPVNPDYGNATTGAYVGCELSFPDDDYVWNKHLPADKIMNIKLPDKIEEAYPYNDMISQVKYMNLKYNQNILPVILPRGILNEAFLIEGDKIFEDMYVEPDEAKRILDFSYSILEKTVRYNASLGYHGLVRILNCTVQLINPKLYKELLLPYDKKIYNLAYSLGMTFGIHHCGLLDPVMDSYREISNVSYLQMGFDSDLEKAVAIFPETDLHYIIDPVFCMNSSPDTIASKVDEVLMQAGIHIKDISIGVGALDYGTPIDNLIAIKDTLSV